MQLDLKVWDFPKNLANTVCHGFDSHLQILIEVAQLVRATVQIAGSNPAPDGNQEGEMADASDSKSDFWKSLTALIVDYQSTLDLEIKILIRLVYEIRLVCFLNQQSLIEPE